jgi:hypothetical protein
MIATLSQYLEAFKDQRALKALRGPLDTLVDRYSSQPLTSAGLVIHGSASALAKTGAADFYAVANGVLVKIAASTDMPALTGINTSAGNFTVACFFIDSAGTVTAGGGTQGATLGAVLFPPFPRGKALVGFLIISGAGAFTGGTTALDTATTQYISPLGPFDPSALV